ncbi:hypothetical protein [Nitrososphaera sp.]|uniref:hypothetical protein n=1 Tax=Nitrososphaera sp. TaxID=1971748 RepID=UPI00307D7921
MSGSNNNNNNSNKLFSFNAGSFTLDGSVEEFLRSRGAIALDFGSSVYLNSSSVASILAELASAARQQGKEEDGDAQKQKQQQQQQQAESVMAQLRAELQQFSLERQKLIDENGLLAQRARSAAAEIESLRSQNASLSRSLESLRAENARIQAAKTVTAAPSTATATTLSSAAADQQRLRQSYEKLVQEFNRLRSQSIEAITSLKVLEEENEALREELEMLKEKAKGAPPQQQKAI